MMNKDLKEVQDLVHFISKEWLHQAGFSIRSLVEVSDSDFINQTTVMIFKKNSDSNDLKQIDIPGTKKKILRYFSGIDDTFQNLISAEESGQFVIGDQNIIIEKDIGPVYAWEIENTWRKNGLSAYGLDRPATILHYKIGRSVQWDSQAKGIREYESLDDLIWFGLVADGERRPEYQNWRFKEYGIHLIVPHWHAYIDKLEVTDKENIVNLGTDIGTPVWKHISLRYKRKHESGESFPAIISQLSDVGTSRLPNERPDVRQTEVDVFLDSDERGKSFWVDHETAEKVMSETNYGVVIHRLFDPQLNLFKSKLLEPKKDAVGFEWAVMLLFHLAGYRTEWWGYQSHMGKNRPKDCPIEQNEVDLVAIDDNSRTVLAIECTTSEGDISKKVESVAARAVRLKGENAWPKVVLPVLCIPLGATELIATGHPAAFSAQVRILNKEDFTKIIDMIVAGRSIKDISKIIDLGSHGI